MALPTYGRCQVRMIYSLTWLDVEQARTQHHLCGLLSGTLPLIPQQNVFLGLPLRLIPEEVVYLLRQSMYEAWHGH